MLNQHPWLQYPGPVTTQPTRRPTRPSPSFFMPARKHLLSLQKRHWFLLSLSTMHCLLNLHKSSERWCSDGVKNKSKAQEFMHILLCMWPQTECCTCSFCWLCPGGFVPAGVDVTLAYGAPEEALAAIAAGRSIVFACGLVAANGAVGADPVWTREARLGRHAVWSPNSDKDSTCKLHKNVRPSNEMTWMSTLNIS